MKKVDPYLFVLVILSGLVFAMHGKALAAYIFTDRNSPFRELYFLPHILCLALAVAMQLIRSINISLSHKILSVACVSIIGVMGIQILSSSPSVLVFSVQLMTLIFVNAVIALEPTVMDESLSKEFWELFLGVSLKLIQFLLALYVAGFALLKFLSDGVAESQDSFLTSFIYPTISFVYGIFIVAYWLGVPIWENIVQAHRIPNREHKNGLNLNSGKVDAD